MSDKRLERIDFRDRRPTFMNVVYAVVSRLYNLSPYRIAKHLFDENDETLLVEECYNLSLLAILVALLLLGLAAFARASALAYVGIVIAGWRLADLFVAHAKMVLLESERGRAMSEEDGEITVRHAQRWPVMVLLDFLHVVICFAILYVAIDLLAGPGAAPFTVHFFGTANPSSLMTALLAGVNAFYFSLVTIVTLGYGDFAPAFPAWRALVSVEIIYGLFFLVFVFIVVMPTIRTKRGSTMKFRD